MSRDSTPRLGRGLAALLGDDSSGATKVGSAPVRSLPTELLEPSPFQPRKRLDREGLAELIQSIKARGILQPLLVRPHPHVADHYQIVAGERRWRAAQEAGVHEVPALVRELTDSDAMAAGLVENLQREDLNPIEEAEGYQRLVAEFGMTQDALAQTVGKSRSHIANTLRLLHLPDPVKMEVRNGALSAGHARALLSVPDPQAAALNVIANGLSVRQTEALSEARASRSPQPREKDPTTQALERDLSERLGLKVEISFDGKAGSMRIHYRSIDQLDGVITLLRSG